MEASFSEDKASTESAFRLKRLIRDFDDIYKANCAKCGVLTPEENTQRLVSISKSMTNVGRRL